MRTTQSERARLFKAFFFVLLCLGGALVASAPALAQDTIELPIEVYPTDGRSSTIEAVTIQASNGSSADSLFFQMHQPHYHKGGWETGVENGFDPQTMVDVRLNGGTWVPVRNANVNCAYPEQAYECVAGAFSTIRFAMSAADLGNAVDGENTLEFRFNGTEGVRSGFRVLAIGFMRPGDDLNSFVPLPKRDATESLIDGTTFEEWDPGSWTAPDGYGDAQSVSAGETLWKAENSLKDIDGASIVAGCASCHATDGRDLQYFAYSNETIVARSQAHGLSESEGKEIAAYIRNVTLQTEAGTTYDPPGTPWDPPYQPGPAGFGPDNKHPDEADVAFWAAGAGLEWVLENDSESAQYLWPASGDKTNPQGLALTAGGDLPWKKYRSVDKSEWGGNGGTDAGTAINMREIPVAVQFPDWNNWLPDVHPHDGMPAPFNGSDIEAHMAAGETTFEGGDLGSIETWLSKTNGKYYQDIKRNIDDDDPSSGGNTSLTPNQWIHAITGGTQWRAVKTWYFLHKYHVEDKADDLNCDDSDDEWCEPRGWLGRPRTVFDIAPHVSGADWDDAPHVYKDKGMDGFYSHVWYQLQMVLNPGTSGNTGIVPVDEGYQETFLEESANHYNRGAGPRQAISEWKLWQLYSNPDGAYKGSVGLIPGNSTLDRVLKMGRTGHRKNVLWDRVSDDHKALWLEGYIRMVADYLLPRISSLERTDSGLDDQGFQWNALDYVPPVTDLPADKDFAGQIYNYTRGIVNGQDGSLQDVYPSVAAGALDSLVAIGDCLAPDDRDDGYDCETTKSWPSDQPRWHDLVDYSGSSGNNGNNQPSVSLTSPSDGASFTAPASISVSAEASDSDGSVTKVGFYAGSSKIDEVTNAPFETSWDDVPAGTYTLTAKATDDAGATTTSDAANVTVATTGTAQNGVNYEYFEGDWSQLPDFSTLSALTTGTTDNFTLAVRERDEQFGIRYVTYVDIPSSATGTYTFYTTSDDGSRLLVDDQEVVNNDGMHAAKEQSSTISLSSGWHKIAVEYFEQGGGEELLVEWNGPTFSRKEMSSARLFLSPETSGTQSIALKAGWNLISSYLTPSDNSLSVIFSDVETALGIVQNQQGDAYDPAAQDNTLDTWDPNEGYRVYVTSTKTLEIQGSPLSSPTLTLEAGWNLIPFYPTTGVPVDEAFQSISGALEIVKDEAGNSYVPNRGINEIGTLKPGKAYKVFVSEDVTFSYP